MASGFHNRYHFKNNKLLELVQTGLLSYKADALVLPIDKDASFDPNRVRAHAELGSAGPGLFEHATSMLPKYTRTDKLTGVPDESAYAISTGGKLPHRYAVFCVTARYLRVSHGPVSHTQVSCTRDCIEHNARKALNLAREKGAVSIAFPALGMEYELPLETSIEAIGREVLDHFKLPDSIQRVGILLNPCQEYTIAEGVLNELSTPQKPIISRKKAP